MFSALITVQQSTHVTVSAAQGAHDTNAEEIYQFVSNQLRRVIQGEPPDQGTPPPIELHCRHLVKVS